MKISPREQAMAAVTLMILLYGMLGLGARGRLDTIRMLYRMRDEQARLLEDRGALVAQRAEWERQYAGLRELMPVFEPGRRVDTYWLGIMDRLAAKNNLSIIRRQVGTERQIGDVYEMSIECRDWEGSLEALVGFLYDLQSEGAMLDVRQMFVRPTPNRPALLRGSFTLYCAYLRGVPAAPVAEGEEEIP